MALGWLWWRAWVPFGAVGAAALCLAAVALMALGWHATLSHTIFVTHHFSHKTLSHTIFHTQLCHTPSFTHNFVTHNFVTDHLSQTTLSHTIFHTLAQNSISNC